MSPVSIFSDAQLSEIVRETLVTVPPGHKNAVVAAVNAHGVSVVAGFTFDTGWKVQGAYAHDWSGTDAVGAHVMKSW